jgi:hypothetical protein
LLAIQLFENNFLRQSFLIFILFYLLSRQGKEVRDDLRGPELSARGAGHPVQEAAILPVEWFHPYCPLINRYDNKLVLYYKYCDPATSREMLVGTVAKLHFNRRP